MVENELPENILDLLFLRWEDGSYRGWRSSLLMEKIAKLEEKFLICNFCQGLLREACLFRNGNKQELRCIVCVPGDVTIHQARINQESVNEKCIGCPLKDEGCDWSGRITKVLLHLNKCDFVRVECPLGCVSESEKGEENRVELIERGFLEEHQTIHCSMRVLNCEFCSIVLKAFQMNEHVEICEECLTQCPNSCQEENEIKKIKRKAIPTHLDEYCPLKVVACSYDADGCCEKMERRFLEEHQKSICSMRQVNCESCRIELKAFEMIEHIQCCEEYVVLCPNSCEEESEVRMLKRRDIPKHLEEECPLKIVDCPNVEFGCTDKMERHLVPEHQEDLCHMRRVECECCENKIRACEVNEHIEICTEYLVVCPNSCLDRRPSTQCISELEETRRLKRKYLRTHLDEECPLQVVECPYAEYGCRERLERRFLEQHGNEFISSHFRISMDKMKQHSIKISFLERENTSRVDEISRIHKKQTEEISRIRYNNSLEIMELKDEIDFLISAINNSPRGSLFWKITGVKEKIKGSVKSLSDPFYVGLYKCQCELVWNHENQGNVGCFLHIMVGDCDDKLTWPFRWKYTLILINQKVIGHNFVSSCDLNEFKQLSPKSFQNPGEIKNYSFELLEFIPLDKIQKEKYLKNDSISLKIIIE